MKKNMFLISALVAIAIASCEVSGGGEPVNLKSKTGVTDTSICSDIDGFGERLKSDGAVLEYSDNNLVVGSHYFATNAYSDMEEHYRVFCENEFVERRVNLSPNHENSLHFIAYKKNLRLPPLSPEGKNLLQSRTDLQIEYLNPGYGVISWNRNLTDFAVLDLLEQAGVAEPQYRVIGLGPLGQRLLFVHGSIPQ